MLSGHTFRNAEEEAPLRVGSMHLLVTKLGKCSGATLFGKSLVIVVDEGRCDVASTGCEETPKFGRLAKDGRCS